MSIENKIFPLLHQGIKERLQFYTSVSYCNKIFNDKGEITLVYTSVSYCNKIWNDKREISF